MYLRAVDLGLVDVAAGCLALEVWPDVARTVDPAVRPKQQEETCHNQTVFVLAKIPLLSSSLLWLIVGKHQISSLFWL